MHWVPNMKLLIISGHKSKKEEITSVRENIEVPDSVLLSGGKFDGVITKWAKKHSLPIEKIVAHTRYHREYAVFIRNQRLAEYADGALVIYNQISDTLQHLITRFRVVKKPVTVYHVKNQQATRLSWRASSSSAPEKRLVKLCTVDTARTAPSS